MNVTNPDSAKVKTNISFLRVTGGTSKTMKIEPMTTDETQILLNNVAASVSVLTWDATGKLKMTDIDDNRTISNCVLRQIFNKADENGEFTNCQVTTNDILEYVGKDKWCKSTTATPDKSAQQALRGSRRGNMDIFRRLTPNGDRIMTQESNGKPYKLTTKLPSVEEIRKQNATQFLETLQQLYNIFQTLPPKPILPFEKGKRIDIIYRKYMTCKQKIRDREWPLETRMKYIQTLPNYFY